MVKGVLFLPLICVIVGICDRDSEKLNIDNNTSQKFKAFSLELPPESSTSFLLDPIYSINSPAGTILFLSGSNLLKEVESQLSERVDIKKLLDWNEDKFKEYRVFYFCPWKPLTYTFNSPLRLSGVINTESLPDANLIWLSVPMIDEIPTFIENLNKYQRYNHFPTTWEFGAKDRLWSNYKRMKEKFPSDFKFMQDTYLLQEDKEIFLKILKKNPQTLWLQKPYIDYGSHGVEIVNDIDSIPENHLVTRYISNPHLINNKKYDIRMYVLVTGFSPLKIYLFEEGHVRFAAEDYSTDKENLKNRFVHLTIMGINVESDKFDHQNINDNDEFRGSRWSLGAYRHYFEYKNLDFKNLWTKIKDLVVKTVISIADRTIESIKKLTKHKNSMFELYGIDILVDKNLSPWLLEVNTQPAIEAWTAMDIKITSAMLSSVLNTIGLVPYSHLDQDKDNPKVLFEDENQGDDDENEIRCNSKEDNYEYNDTEPSFEIVNYSLDEFSRSGLFERVFPLKSNIDYYSKFLDNPGEENLILWEFMKNSLDNI